MYSAYALMTRHALSPARLGPVTLPGPAAEIDVTFRSNSL